MTELLLVPISALNQYVFRPRRCWYMHVAHEFLDNVYTIEGSLLHGRADSGEATRRGDLLQIRNVSLYSLQYGLTGKADLIEEQSGGIYPVEFKKGKRKPGMHSRMDLSLEGIEMGKGKGLGRLREQRAGATIGSSSALRPWPWRKWWGERFPEAFSTIMPA